MIKPVLVRGDIGRQISRGEVDLPSRAPTPLHATVEALGYVIEVRDPMEPLLNLRDASGLRVRFDLAACEVVDGRFVVRVLVDEFARESPYRKPWHDAEAAALNWRRLCVEKAAEKAEHVRRYNSDHPSAAIGYLPTWRGVVPSQDSREAAKRGEVVTLEIGGR